MEMDLSGENLATLLKDLADRIQTNHDSTEGIIMQLRDITKGLEEQNRRNDA